MRKSTVKCHQIPKCLWSLGGIGVDRLMIGPICNRVMEEHRNLKEREFRKPSLLSWQFKFKFRVLVMPSFYSLLPYRPHPPATATTCSPQNIHQDA